MRTNSLGFNIVVAVVIVAVSLGLVWLRKNGVIPTDAATRWSMAIIGLLLALHANFIPKQVKVRGAGMRRVAGWAFVLGGLAYAAAWMFAPMSIAADLSMAAVGLGMAWVIAWCLWFRPRAVA